jgi:Tfp pilus assembly protein PilO
MINQREKNIVVITGVCVLVIFLFWVFVYLPADKRLRVLKTDLKNVKDEVSQIQARGGKNGRDMITMVESLQKDFKSAMLKFPKGEEETLKLLSQEANKLGMEIVSIKQGSKRPFLDSSNNLVFCESEQCFEIPIAVEMRGLYRSVGEFLNVLREGFPAFIKTEEIRIGKDEMISPKRRINLELRLYILGKE